MKSDKKSKKRDYSDSEEETVAKKKKRRYRNDRSRKKESSSDDSDSSPGRRKKSDKRSEKKRDSSSESSEERSRKNKKKKQKDTSEDDSSSSEEEKVKKSKRHESKRKSRKKSPKPRSSPSSRKKSSKRKSRSPTRSSRKKQSSESPSPDARKVKSKAKSPKPKSPKPKSKSPTPQRTTAKSSSKQSGSPAIEDSPAKSADSSADSSQISIASPPVVKTHVKDIPVKIELPKHKQSDDVSYDIIFSDEFLQSRANDKTNLGDENEFTEESSMDVLEDIVKSKMDDAEDDIKSTLPQEKEEQPVKSPKEEKKDLPVVTKAVPSSENTEVSKKENSKGEAPQKVESKTEEKHREVKHKENVTKEIKKEEQTIEPVKKEEVKEPVEKIKEEAVKTEESENDEEDSLVIKPPESKVKKESKSKSSVSDKGKRSKSPASKRRKSKSPPRNKRSYRKRSRSPRSSRRSSSRSPTRRKRSPDRKKSDDKKSEKSKSSQEIKSKELKKEDKALRKRKERLDEWRKAQMKSTTETSADSATAATENGTSEDKKATNGKAQKEVKKEDKISEEVLKPKKIEVKITSGVKKFEIVNKTVLKKKPLVAIKMEMEEVDDTKEEEENDEDMDPLDAYMKQIDKQVGKIKKKPTKKLDGKGKTLMVVKTVVKKKEAPVTAQKTKPELMEQNQDAMEYSSEGEAPGDVTAGDFTDITKKKKELTVADHSKIYYAAFKRDFYVEVPELARMTADEVKLYRETLGDIQVRGKNIPKPIRSWSQAGVSTKVMNVLKKLKYEKPTPIQAQAIPAVMSGRDMIGIAKTGSGKTLAFLIPMFRHVLDQPALDEQDGPIAIIMTPTRELALQIFREAKKFCKALHLTAACIYGGSGISEQIAELKKGAEIIVCTPGRMIDMLTANNGKVTNCRRSTYLVLDEADRMFDMGFEPQVMRIIDNIRPDRQTVLFSATFPRQMEAVARKVLSKPIEIQVGGRSIVCSDVEQHALVIEEENKFFKTLELLGGYQEKGSVLIFVEKQESADALFKDLLKNGYPCLSLHGGMDQFDRDSTIADFKNGVTKLMVSTSVAARGLDVKNLVLVLNYDCPNHYEDYVHRVGRTGRAGNKGTSFTYLTPEQGRNAGDVIRAFELAKSSPPEDVVKLYETFKEEMKAAGKTVRANSGFTGKGFKFNQEEDSQVVDAKKQQKFSLGLQTSDDEAEAAENALEKIDADLEKAFSNKPKIALAPEVVEAQKTKAAEHTVDKGKVNQASKLVALLNKKLSSGQVVDRNTQATASILSGGSLASLKGVGLAKQLADKVNAKLNYIKADEPERVEPVEAKPSSNVRYEEEIDINDFPQSARWRITSKEIIEQVREISECGLTVRGIYIPPNKKPDEDDRRLHLYLESLNERAIEIAKAEIKRLLREELIKAESRSYKPHQQTGRYKVL